MVIADVRVLIYTDRAALYSADTYSANVIVVVDRGNEELKLAVLISLGCGNIGKYLFKKGNEVCACNVGILGSSTCSARAVEHRAVKLLVGGVEIDKKLKYLVLDLAETGIGLVYLVDNDDDSVVKLKRSLKNEASLRHRALSRVNEKDNAVNHLENTLYLAAEVSVSGSVYKIDLYVLVVNGGVLGENCDSSLLFKIARVHYASNRFLILTVDTALLEHFVNKGSLSVVNVSNYGYVS